MAAPPLYFKYGNEVERVVSDPGGVYDLTFLGLQPRTIRLDGMASLIDIVTMRTKHNIAWLHESLGQDRGSSEETAIVVTGSPGVRVGSPGHSCHSPHACKSYANSSHMHTLLPDVHVGVYQVLFLDRACACVVHVRAAPAQAQVVPAGGWVVSTDMQVIQHELCHVYVRCHQVCITCLPLMHIHH